MRAITVPDIHFGRAATLTLPYGFDPLEALIDEAIEHEEAVNAGHAVRPLPPDYQIAAWKRDDLLIQLTVERPAGPYQCYHFVRLYKCRELMQLECIGLYDSEDALIQTFLQKGTFHEIADNACFGLGTEEETVHEFFERGHGDKIACFPGLGAWLRRDGRSAEAVARDYLWKLTKRAREQSSRAQLQANQRCRER